MQTSSRKINILTKQVALFSSLFLAVFAIGFLLMNADLSFLKSEKNVGDESEKRPAIMQGEKPKVMGSYAKWARYYGVSADIDSVDQDDDSDGLNNYIEYQHGTNPINTDTDGDGFSDADEMKKGFDPDASGDTKTKVIISIPKIKVAAPMIWSQSDDEKTMLSELESGVLHYVDSAAPGQPGNSIIAGHSSNYVWAKGDFNQIFRNLNNLNAGDVVEIKTIQQNGSILVYQYAVNEKFVSSPEDERIFANSSQSSLTLSTCWPIGTNLKRLIVKLELI